MANSPFDHHQLRALAAVLHAGAFAQAAVLLGVTPSAVSQRIRALEEAVGSVLIVRGTPCIGTPLGRRLAAHADEALRRDLALAAEIGIGGDHARATVRIAVNADSLATWMLGPLAAVPDLNYDLMIDDQEFSDGLLRRGEVAAAVTAHGKAVQGCDVWALGALRYVAVASPGFRDSWFGNGVTARTLQHAPCLTYNARDGLQDHWMRRLTGQQLAPPRHWIPSSEGFLDAARLGLGWGMNPVALAAPHLRTGALVELPGGVLDIALYWQALRLMRPLLAPLTRSVRRAAGAALITPPPQPQGQAPDRSGPDTGQR